MMQSEFATMMQGVFDEEINALRKQGQAEYAGGEDVDCFANFHRVATDLGIDRKMVLWTYARKHIDGITHFLRGHESQREDVTGRINDMIVYLFLLRGMIDEERAEVQPLGKSIVQQINETKERMDEALTRAVKERVW